MTNSFSLLCLNYFNAIPNVEFLDYESLNKMYEYTLQEQFFKTRL